MRLIEIEWDVIGNIMSLTQTRGHKVLETIQGGSWVFIKRGIATIYPSNGILIAKSHTAGTTFLDSKDMDIKILTPMARGLVQLIARYARELEVKVCGETEHSG